MSTDSVYGGVNPEGKRMLRIEARNAQTPIERKPSWIRTKLRTGPEYLEIRELVKCGSRCLHLVSVTHVFMRTMDHTRPQCQ